MKYWGYFLAKLTAILLFMRGVWPVFQSLLPEPDELLRANDIHPMGRDLASGISGYAAAPA